MPSDGRVIKPGRHVPRQVKRPLGVAVVREKVAPPVEVKIVWIAKAARQRLKGFAVRRKSNDRAAFGFLEWRLRRIKLAGREAGVVAADEIKPAVRPLADRVCSVLAVGQAQELPGRPVRSAIGVGIVVAEQGTVGHSPQVGSVEQHAHRAVIQFGELHRHFRAAVTVGVVQRADVAAPRDDHAPFRVERHRVNVICQLRPGKQRGLEAAMNID